MPTITVSHEDMCGLIGRKLSVAELESRLDVAKAELKSADEDELRIELNDTNRPDLWCAEGIARQIRCADAGRLPEYAFFGEDGKPAGRIEVDAGMASLRPCVGGFVVRGLKVTEHVLVQLIQSQEKLCENFGSRRRAVAIGIYNLRAIRFPVSYKPVGRTEVRFTPLECDEPMTPERILKEHPTGKEYGHLLEGCERVPILMDADGKVLSMPPIINSREVGEVQPGDSDLFVEATGTDWPQVLLCLNILAANVADRGGQVEPAEIAYPYDTGHGRVLRAPRDQRRSLSASVATFEKILGVSLTVDEVETQLRGYGCHVERDGDGVTATLPPWRQDYMHPVDVVEDFAMARGYDTFEPAMPTEFTVGGVTEQTRAADAHRDLMVGLGYEELVSPILGSHGDFTRRMRSAEPLVEIANPMSESYAAVRPSILPSLLRVEAASAKALFPHRTFEVGEVAVPDAGENHGSRTEMRLGALLSHAEASLSELHAVLDALGYYLTFRYELAPGDDPRFLEGRCAAVERGGETVGVIGELHPEVLEMWGIRMPCATLELRL